MRPITCLIVDDEPLAHRVIENFARDLRFLKIVRKCRNAMEAREALHEEERIDLIFLDIQMPKLTGLAFMRSLQHPPLVIFTTAYADHALESYELEAVDYLKKPFSFERFSRALEKAQRRLGLAIPMAQGEESDGSEEPAGAVEAANPSVIFIKSEGAKVRVDLSEIVLVEGVGDYVKIVRSGGNLLCHESLQQWEQRLPSPAFVRVHKSYIVPLRKIDTIKAGEISIGSRRVPIGRAYRAKLDRAIGSI